MIGNNYFPTLLDSQNSGFSLHSFLKLPIIASKLYVLSFEKYNGVANNELKIDMVALENEGLHFLSLINLKKVLLETPIIEETSVLVIGGVDAFGLPNLTHFSFAILIPSALRSLISFLSFSATNDST